MVLLELFWSFVKIGFTSFGGLSMIPLITSEVLSHGWMTAAEGSDIVAIAEMTPGPLASNRWLRVPSSCSSWSSAAVADVNTGRITGRAASSSARHSNILVPLRMVFIVSPRCKICYKKQTLCRIQ